jgi:tRNA-dihydrouridine synthase
LLDDPGRLERVVAACVRGVAGAAPVTAKIRAGIEDDSRVEELARAVEEGGAELLTIHCRTRDEKFQKEVDWTRITRAVNSVSIPVCGNGGIGTHTDLARMLEEVGCAYAMVGQAALGDPWIFSGIEVSRGEAARFLLEYAATLEERGTTSRQGVAGRIKQLLRHWTAGDLLRGELRDWLVEESTEGLLARLEAATR